MMKIEIQSLVAAHRAGRPSPLDTIAALLPDLDRDPAVWISRFSDEALLERAAQLEVRGPEGLPLYGVPFAVKDNIDVLGLATTAACPEFAYEPLVNSFAVQTLLDAGAICIGKTNLDQFATGLVGVRTPYGIPKNPFNPDYIPGGSSCGSAVAVASGLVAFALGTDTAGSGRVPAAFNNLVGWKPTRGLVSNTGVVPACKTLDCISIFANTVEDIATVADVIGRFDKADAFARPDPRIAQRRIRKVGIPRPEQLEFFGDSGYAACWEIAVQALRERGIEVVDVDFSPFRDAAKLLYEGPWVAERFLATHTILESAPDAMHPVTRSIVEGGQSASAADAFSAQYRLAELRRTADAVWDEVDAICTPTAGTIYRVAEVAADPLRLNSNLGYYTNFMNLLDLCGLAAPAGFREDGMPFGITLVAPAWQDRSLLAFASQQEPPEPEFEIAVCGAHLSGLALNWQLTSRGARLLQSTRTAPVYQMFALDEKRPGLVRVADGGGAIEVEVWSLPVAEVGGFLAGIPAPLGLGRVFLEDGSNVCGFVCEPIGVINKPEITHLGGWRKFPG